MNGLDGIIGMWTDGQSEIAIIKDEGFYKAYMIRSTLKSIEPGELKAKFQASEKGIEGIFYSYKYAHKYVAGDLYKEQTLLVLTGGMYWAKLGSSAEREVNMINKENTMFPVVQKLDEQNTLLSIPSFLIDANQFNKVLFDNIEMLTNTINLIIDIRGNIGGNSIYFDLISAYATNPLRGSQGLVLASEDTRKYFESLMKYDEKIYQPLVSRIEDNIGEIVEGPAYPEKIFNPFPSKIQKVAILTDEGCASAAESFILQSKGASTKVTTFGSPTAGIIDYTSVNMVKLESGSQNILFGYPTSTYHKDIPLKGYNQTGIVPDVPIADKEKDKVQFIVDWLKKTKK
ncbi:MAG: S41 family peptidase [Cytophagales bacterium]|nr:S41 family peptidase [Cytophagales bacterium]